jgi:hypothetical protein
MMSRPHTPSNSIKMKVEYIGLEEFTKSLQRGVTRVEIRFRTRVIWRRRKKVAEIREKSVSLHYSIVPIVFMLYPA